MSATPQAFDLSNPSAPVLLFPGIGRAVLAPAAVSPFGGEAQAATKCAAAGASSVTMERPGEWSMVLDFAVEDGWTAIRARLSNLGKEALRVDQAVVARFASILLDNGLDRAFRHGVDLTDYTRVVGLEKDWSSHCLGGWTNAAGDGAIVAGFAELDSAFTEVAWTVDGGKLASAEARVLRDGVPLEPGAELALPTLLVGGAEGLSDLQIDYARRVARHTPGRYKLPIETGWCSWYYYYGRELAEDIYRNMDSLAECAVAEHLRTIQIDDGWNLTAPDAPRNWGDWEAGPKFPEGMKAVADRIHAKGFKAGLWLAPFSVEKASNLFKDHPDWLVQGPGKDEPADFWGVYGLDLTHPGALAYLESVFTRVFDEWGYDYVKLDFLIHAMQPGRRHDPTKTRAQMYRDAMGVIRRCAGDDRFILGCGSPMGPAVGLVDGMRIGTDVSSRWYLPMNLGGWPEGNCCAKSSVIQTAYRQWMHGIWWQNDPDCIQTRDYATEHEKAMFDNFFPGQFDHLPYGLAMNEAECWCKMIWLSGGMTLLSEYLPDLSPERRAMAQRMFPVNPDPARLVDWHGHPDIVVMRNEASKPVVGIFNINDDAYTLEIPARKVLPGGGSRPRRFVECWSGEAFDAPAGDTIRFPEIPGRSARLWRAE